MMCIITTMSDQLICELLNDFQLRRWRGGIHPREDYEVLNRIFHDNLPGGRIYAADVHHYEDDPWKLLKWLEEESVKRGIVKLTVDENAVDHVFWTTKGTSQIKSIDDQWWITLEGAERCRINNPGYVYVYG